MCNNECCCKCIHQVKVVKHPSNVNELAKGKMGELMGYGCDIIQYEDKENVVIFSESSHGECEMFSKRYF